MAGILLEGSDMDLQMHAGYHDIETAHVYIMVGRTCPPRCPSQGPPVSCLFGEIGSGAHPIQLYLKRKHRAQCPPPLLHPSKLPPSRLPPSRLPPSRLPPSKLPPSKLPPSRLHPSRLPPSRLPPSRHLLRRCQSCTLRSCLLRGCLLRGCLLRGSFLRGRLPGVVEHSMVAFRAAPFQKT